MLFNAKQLNILLRNRSYYMFLHKISQRACSHSPFIPKLPKFERWQDVPDEMVKKWSHRDPDNLVYLTPEWSELKKKQIFVQSNPEAALRGEKILLNVILGFAIILNIIMYYEELMDDSRTFRNFVEGFKEKK